MPSMLQRFMRSLVSLRSNGSDHLTLPVTAGDAALNGFNIPVGDPLANYLCEHPVVIEVNQVEIESEALQRLKLLGVHLIAPLVCRGELVGLLSLGPRMSTQEYSQEDTDLLNNLVTQAAPALRIAQLAELRQAEALENERLGQELRVARLIQKTLLPKTHPAIAGWQISSHYRPARAVGGDFYDFLPYPDGQMAFVIGDVTDKGMPAALLMATTRATLRAAAQRYLSPGELLAQVNEILVPDTPESMFVTCLIALLDPRTGRLIYANAGHNLPYCYGGGVVSELRATGMPLGLLPGMQYDEAQATIAPGSNLLLYSDGLVEARNARRELFGNRRLENFLSASPVAQHDTLHTLLVEMEHFTSGMEQEDDVTLVELRHVADGGSR